MRRVNGFTLETWQRTIKGESERLGGENRRVADFLSSSPGAMAPGKTRSRNRRDGSPNQLISGRWTPLTGGRYLHNSIGHSSTRHSQCSGFHRESNPTALERQFAVPWLEVLSRACKGRKERLSPLWSQTAEIVGALLAERSSRPALDEPLFRNHRGARLTRFGARYILRKYCTRAQTATPTLAAKRLHLSPQLLRPPPNLTFSARAERRVTFLSLHLWNLDLSSSDFGRFSVGCSFGEGQQSEPGRARLRP
jgi:hypothetical protein